MNRNEGSIDRVVRIVLGLVLLALIFVGPKTWFGLLGIPLLVTGLVGYCPLYPAISARPARSTRRD